MLVGPADISVVVPRCGRSDRGMRVASRNMPSAPSSYKGTCHTWSATYHRPQQPARSLTTLENDLKEGSPPTDTSQHWESSARDHYLKNNYPEARVAIERALSIDPENYYALILAAAIVGQLGGSEGEIISLYDRAIRKRPDDAEAYSAKALSLADSGHTAQAVDIARNALDTFKEEEKDLRSKAYSVYDTLADVLFRSGRIDEARKLAKEAESRYGFERFAQYLWSQDH
jgi:tetratricopeptide (TPR) repeat protein